MYDNGGLIIENCKSISLNGWRGNLGVRHYNLHLPYILCKAQDATSASNILTHGLVP